MSENFSDWDDDFEEEVNLTTTDLPRNETVPNSTAVLVLGIISIPCCCFSIIGVALGVVALFLAKEGLSSYNSNPIHYSQTSYNNLRSGRVCAIIGLVLSSISLIFSIISQIAGHTLNDLNNYNW